MKHFQLELLIAADLGLIILHDVVVTNTETRSIKIKFRLLFRRDPDTDLAFGVNSGVQQIELLFVIDDRNRIFETVIDQRRNILDILRTLETVADDKDILVDNPAVVQRVDDMNVISRRGFEVNVVLQRLFQHE